MQAYDDDLRQFDRWNRRYPTASPPQLTKAKWNTRKHESAMPLTGLAYRWSCCMAVWVIVAIGAIRFQRWWGAAIAPF